MKKIMYVLLFCSLFTSCYTEQIANKQAVKIQARFPNVLAQNCSLFYPVKTETHTETIYTEGKTDTLINYQYLNCDTVINNPTKYINRLIKLPYSVINKQTDTITKNVFRSVENTAKITTLTNQLKELEMQNILLKKKYQFLASLVFSLCCFFGFFIIILFVYSRLKR